VCVLFTPYRVSCCWTRAAQHVALSLYPPYRLSCCWTRTTRQGEFIIGGSWARTTRNSGNNLIALNGQLTHSGTFSKLTWGTPTLVQTARPWRQAEHQSSAGHNAYISEAVRHAEMSQGRVEVTQFLHVQAGVFPLTTLCSRSLEQPRTNYLIVFVQRSVAVIGVFWSSALAHDVPLLVLLAAADRGPLRNALLTVSPPHTVYVCVCVCVCACVCVAHVPLSLLWFDGLCPGSLHVLVFTLFFHVWRSGSLTRILVC